MAKLMEEVIEDEANNCDDIHTAAFLNTAAQVMRRLRASLTKAQDRNKILDCLEECGVDNWEGYSEAMALYNGVEEDKEED